MFQGGITVEEETSAIEIGQHLYQERIRRRLSIEEVADALRMRRDYVVALEQGQWDVLPGEVYAQGFCRSYARLLDINPDLLLEPRRHELEGIGQPTPTYRVRTAMVSASEPMPRRPRSNRRRIPKRLAPRSVTRRSEDALPHQGLVWLLVVILILLAGGLWLIHRSQIGSSVHTTSAAPHHVKAHLSTPKAHPSTPKTKTKTPPPATKTKSPPTPKVAGSPKPPALLSSHIAKGLYYASYRTQQKPPIRLSLKFSATCWVSYAINGIVHSAAGHTYVAGDQLKLVASRSLTVTIGNVFGASVTVDGGKIQNIARDSLGHPAVISLSGA